MELDETPGKIDDSDATRFQRSGFSKVRLCRSRGLLGAMTGSCGEDRCIQMRKFRMFFTEKGADHGIFEAPTASNERRDTSELRKRFLGEPPRPTIPHTLKGQPGEAWFHALFHPMALTILNRGRRRA